MAGLAIIINREGSGPVVEDDAILTDGSLILIDPIHTLNPWGSGVPAHNSEVPNIASAKVAALLEATEGTEYPSTFLLGGGINDGTKGLVERTGKGALHGVVSQANSLSSGDGVAFGIHSDIKAYLVANNAHNIYMSQWSRVTRPNGGTLSSTGALESGVMGSGTGSSSGLVTCVRAHDFLVSNSSGTVAVATNTSADPGLNVAGERFMAVATGSGSGASASTAFAGPFWGAYPGTFNAGVLASRNTYWPSFGFQRFYVEDLTVSGRTFSEVAAMDQALWEAAVASDGRYGSDTYTAVTEVP